MAITIANLTNWNESISDALVCVKTVCFPEKLEHAIRQLIDFDICMVFSYSSEISSTCLHHNLADVTAKVIIDDYLEGPYLLDPFYGAVIRGKRDGFGAMRALAPDQFYRSEFYRHHYVKTGIADEIGIFFPISENTTAVLSVTRQKPKPQFSDRDKKKFAAVACLIQKVGSLNWETKSQVDFAIRDQTTIDIVFDSFGLGVLTAREREIIAMVLKGHSSASIGQVLNISTGTVKIHRKNAYDKLKVSSQAELFSLFLASLSRKLGSKHLNVD